MLSVWVGLGAWAWTWAWAAMLVTATLVRVAALRTNVVAEVPTLDVGPLVGVTVARGDTARLLCRHPRYPDDTLNLVLWYLNHTSRPFLSYDARARLDTANTTSINSIFATANSSSSSSSSSNEKPQERRYLEAGGTTLVIKEAWQGDQAEYRCRVHYRLSPTWTQRLLLLVPERVEGLVLEDASGRAVGERLQPLAEGANLTLTCQAIHGLSEVVSLTWQLEGQELDSSWASAGEGVAVNQLHLVGVEQRHRDAHLTCRLVSVDATSNLAAAITHRSTTIAMFYVPETRLRVEGGRVGVGGEWEVSEGDSLIFLCDVHADPPAYNITWLLNGRVVGVGGRRWMRDNASLVVSPVERSDAGLYTCLASNREGDGHSNAILVRVTHAPYCAGPSEQSLVVASNTSVTLTCRVEAVPRDLKFTWKMGSPVAVLKGKGEPPPPRHSGDLPSTSLSSPPVGGGPSSMHAHTPRPQMPLGTYPPRLEQVQVSKNVVRVAASVQVAAASPSAVAASPSEAASLSEAAPPTEAAWRKLGKDSWEVRGSMEDGEEREVEGRVDGGHPDRSSLTLTPAASILVGCYARNSVGHIRIPCTYSITVVEPPKALTDCNVTMVGVTRMEVKCDDPAHARDDHTQVGVEGAHVQHSPSLSFVRSPQASSRANLEVWSGDTLVANVSEGRPHFSVRGLPPSTQLRLVLYTATPHARSTPLYMYTRTLPPTVPHFTVPPPTRPPPTETYPDANDLLDALGWEVVGGVGGVGVVLMLLVAVGVRAWARRRAAAETSESISNSNSLEEQQLHHPHHHPHHASLITTASEESMWGPEWRSSAM